MRAITTCGTQVKDGATGAQGPKGDTGATGATDAEKVAYDTVYDVKATSLIAYTASDTGADKTIYDAFGLEDKVDGKLHAIAIKVGPNFSTGSVDDKAYFAINGVVK